MSYADSLVPSSELLVELFGCSHELRLVLDERQHSHFDGCNGRMEPQQRPLLASNLLQT